MLSVAVAATDAQTSINQSQKLFAIDPLHSGSLRFPRSLDVGADLLAAGQSDSSIAASNGAVSLYRFDGQGWIPETKLVPVVQDASQIGLGASVSIGGSRLAVGATGYNAGQGGVFIFENDGSQWTQTAIIEADQDTFDAAAFGQSVSLSGDTLAVAAPFDQRPLLFSGAVHMYEHVGNSWVLDTVIAPDDLEILDAFGSGGVVLEGNILAVGGLNHDHGSFTGEVRIFVSDGAAWNQTQVLVPSSPLPGEIFGFDIDMSGDVLIVGSKDYAIARVFRNTNGSWVEEAELLDGTAGAFETRVSIDNNRALATQGNSQPVAEFIFDGGMWTLNRLLEPSDAWSIQSPDIAMFDRIAVVPDNRDDDQGVDEGAAYVFDLDLVCPADMDGDQDIDSNDFFAFLDAFINGELAICDIDGDGDCDSDDFHAYLDLFAAGC